MEKQKYAFGTLLTIPGGKEGGEFGSLGDNQAARENLFLSGGCFWGGRGGGKGGAQGRERRREEALPSVIKAKPVTCRIVFQMSVSGGQRGEGGAWGEKKKRGGGTTTSFKKERVVQARYYWDGGAVYAALWGGGGGGGVRGERSTKPPGMNNGGIGSFGGVGTPSLKGVDHCSSSVTCRGRRGKAVYIFLKKGAFFISVLTRVMFGKRDKRLARVNFSADARPSVIGERKRAGRRKCEGKKSASLQEGDSVKRD